MKQAQLALCRHRADVMLPAQRAGDACEMHEWHLEAGNRRVHFAQHP